MPVLYVIDTVSYRKDTHLPLGQGYSMRPGGIAPSTIVIHTTSSAQQNTTFAHEAAYLRDSREVGAHYLNGKQSQIAQILSPDLAAWHAGGKQQDGSWTAQPAYDNSHSIGIENHVSIGEAWTQAQHESLTWLVRLLMARYHIAPAQIETHRKIAIPGPDIRKHDPAGWADSAFYAWRAQLIAPPPVPPSSTPARYQVRPVLLISQRSEGGAPYAGELPAGDVVDVDATYPNGMAHLKSGLGFVPLAGLEPL